MNYYKHHIGDYRCDTAHLSLLEHGVYRQLLDHYYLGESAIPKETESVFRRLCARTEEERKAVETVLSEFFKLEEDGWHHRRCDAEIAEYHSKADSARNNGKLGGRPKKTNSVILGSNNETQSKANITLTTNHKPLTTNQYKTKDKPNKSADELSVLIELGVDEQKAKDWLAVRKSKRAPKLTPSIIGAIQRQAEAAGITFAKAIEISADKGWQGFEAEWLVKNQRAGPLSLINSKHGGFDTLDYHEGIGENGTF